MRATRAFRVPKGSCTRNYALLLSATLFLSSSNPALPATWVTRATNLNGLGQHAILATQDRVTHSMRLLARIPDTLFASSELSPWVWGSSSTGLPLQPQAMALDTTGTIYSAFFNDTFGNFSTAVEGPAPWALHLFGNESNGFGPLGIAVDPATHSPRLLYDQGQPPLPYRQEMFYAAQSPDSSWASLSVDPSTAYSYDRRAGLTISSTGEVHVGATYHYLSSPDTIIFKMLTLDPQTEEFHGPSLIQGTAILKLSMRLARDTDKPISALSVGGKIALAWSSPTEGWVADLVDSTDQGIQSVDAVEDAAGIQYVAYELTAADGINGSVLIASRQSPVSGTRPFAIDTVIHVGMLGGDVPNGIQLVQDDAGNPVLLTATLSQGLGYASGPLYESRLASVTAGIPNADDRDGEVRMVVYNMAYGGSDMTVRLDLPSRMAVRLGVYDTAGRLCATLLDQTLPDGVTGVRWDERGENGARVASGVYFVRLTFPGGTRMAKAVVVR